ncbi:hypothetical protein WJX72_005943 [[Myrmecia] bisecta]|uniref:Uncharacterized protein n=1 Tax=[Myrmecia] bisecta TaxID=41462 RepID=A0AAW1QR17_9CHLO
MSSLAGADPGEPQKDTGLAVVARGPRPHRCNARVEDFIQALFTLEFQGKIRPAWKHMRACFKHEPGHEPSDPYVVIKDPEKYLDPVRVMRPPTKSPPT